MNIEEMPSHTISILVRNKPGVLVRVSQVFARRGFNIDSLVVSPTSDELFSSMTIVSRGQENTLDQIIKQVYKLVDVVSAKEHKIVNSIHKELALFKVECPTSKRAEILQIVDHFKARTLDLSQQALVIETTGSTEKVDALEELLKEYGVIEMIRSGKLVIARGSSTT